MFQTYLVFAQGQDENFPIIDIPDLINPSAPDLTIINPPIPDPVSDLVLDPPIINPNSNKTSFCFNLTIPVDLINPNTTPVCYRSKPCKLGWDQNIEPDMKEYRVYISQMSGMYSFSTDLIFQHPITITGPLHNDFLVKGMNYAVATAIDKSGNESGYSNEIKLMLDTTPDKIFPSVPTEIKAVIECTECTGTVECNVTMPIK